MTEKITLELTLEELKLIDKYVEYSHDTVPLIKKIKSAYPIHRSPVEEAYKECYGEYPSGSPSEDARWGAFQKGYEAAQLKVVPVEEPTKPMDEIVDKLIKEHQAQKLYHRLYDELGYDFVDIENVVSLVEDWLPEPQSASGSQNVDTELLVEGFNDCIRTMKEMLR